METTNNYTCEHNRIKYRCKDCKGSSICEHNRIKYTCKDCKGSAYCEHGRQKAQCKDCGNCSSICEHGIRKSYCRECGGSSICEHGKHKSCCRECGGNNFCKHEISKYICKECNGSLLCKHGICKYRCKNCDGRLLCKSEWCLMTKLKKYDNYCTFCYIHLFPDTPITKNYKTKEKSTVDSIKLEFPELTWVSDKKVLDGCSKRRPDLLLDLGFQVIIIEIDENQHINYDTTCENKRTMELSQDVFHRPIIFIRFNPDDYILDSKKITSCWSINNSGIMSIKKSKILEWDNRLCILKEQIRYWYNNISEKTIHIVELFYDNYVL